jgi:hypothetical protein
MESDINGDEEAFQGWISAPAETYQLVLRLI